MTEHTPQATPGPWRYEGDGWVAVDDRGNQDQSGHCVPICTIRGAQAHQIDSNAHLIAAAPDLLAALEAILPMTGAPHDYTIGDVWKAQEQARAAIAKAKGD